MARMLPPKVFDKTVSRAERRLFVKIKDDLDDRWTVLHSLGFIGHPRKPWAEIDFVLIGPHGIFCLEVKGGRVHREDGAWVFTDRAGRATIKREGPFDQVGSATAALRALILNRLPGVGHAPIQYGVVVPDIPWAVDGPDTPKQLVCDSNDMRTPFSVYVERIAAYWQQWLRSSGRRVGGLDSEERSGVVDLLRGDFDLRPSLSTELGLVEAELLRLTEQQYRIVEGLSLNDRAIVRGGAGTGKTLLAINEARREAGKGKRVLLTCFNRRLADLMAGVLQRVDGVVVRHLHGLMVDLVRRADLESKLPDADEFSLFDVHYPTLAAEALTDLDELGSFDALIVDEGQDLLLHSYLDLFDDLIAGGLSSGRWRVFLDHKQNLYGANEPTALARFRGYAPAQFKLTVNCRNTAPIAMATSLFADTPLDEISDVEGPEVEVRWFTGTDQQVRVLDTVLDELVEENVRLGQVIVLSRRRLGNAGVPRTLPSGTVLWEASQPRPKRQHVEFSTIASFKGLERDVAIVVGIDDLRGHDARIALYVGLSRARGFLVPLVSESQRNYYEELGAILGRRIAAQPGSRGAVN